MDRILKDIKTPLIISAILIVLTLLGAIYYNIFYNYEYTNDDILYIHSFQNYAWSKTYFGFRIRYNGVIEEFDEYNQDQTFKSAKISRYELEKLIALSNIVEDSYEYDIFGPVMNDFGTFSDKIYSQRLSKWLVLYIYGDTNGSNSSDASVQIREFTKKLCKKYLGDISY